MTVRMTTVFTLMMIDRLSSNNFPLLPSFLFLQKSQFTANEPVSPLNNSSVDNLNDSPNAASAARKAATISQASATAAPNSPLNRVDEKEVIENGSSSPSLPHLKDSDEKMDEVDATVDDTEGDNEGKNNSASTASPTTSSTDSKIETETMTTTETIQTTTIATMSTRRLLLNHKHNSSSARAGRAGLREKLVSLR